MWMHRFILAEKILLYPFELTEQLKQKKYGKLLYIILNIALNVIYTILTLSLIALPFVTIYYLIIWGKQTITALDTVVIVALVSGVCSVIGISLTKIQDIKQRNFSIFYQERIKVYARALELIEIRHSYKQTEYTEEELKNEFAKVSRGITLVASPSTLKYWNQYLEVPSEIKGTMSIIAYAFIFNELASAFRRDLGQSNFLVGVLDSSQTPKRK